MAKSPDAAMPLNEHLAELRRRLIISIVSISFAVLPAWLNYDLIFKFLRKPFDDVLAESGNNASLTLGGVIDPFTLQIQVSLISAVFLTAPIWLSQIWGFITPGLHKNERKWAFLFVGTSTPLVAAGAAFAYYIMPLSLQVLIGFTPDNVSNLIAVDRYFDFFFKMVAVFVIGALIPFVIVIMNFANLISAKQIRGWWRVIILSVFLF
ncbi:MAG: hypothetical protein RLZZ330_1026, partial [Actinomycetota bacterium]